MEDKEVEVQLELIKERQRVQDVHLKDVDECCGKLKGATEAELKVLGERIVALESNMDDNCHDVEIDMSKLTERVDNNVLMINSINSNLNKIKILIYSTLIISIAGMIFK